MAEQTQLSAQQRAQLFVQSTRQNRHMLPSQSLGEYDTATITLPKNRLLSKVAFRVEMSVNVKHATKKSIDVDTFTPYKILRRVSLDLNNGFSPYVLNGKELAMYSMVGMHPDIVVPQNVNERGFCFMPDMVASTAGTSNKIAFTCELPVALNDKEPVGLILLQSQETQVNLIIETATAGDIFENADGYTIALESLKITPYTTTFTVPNNANAFPDLSALKLVHARTEQFAGAGSNIVRLATGTIYRKLIVYITDSDGNPMSDSDINGSIELVFNQADINYQIAPNVLATMNEAELGYPLPKGMYVFDFSSAGFISNYGNVRDLVDSEKLTEFWLRFPTTKAGNVTIVSETITRLSTGVN